MEQILDIFAPSADTYTAVNVESTGQYNPEELVPEAIKILLGKITEVEKGLDKLFAPAGP